MVIIIALVGSDGSGKSSLAHYLKKRLEKRGESVRVVFMGWRDFQNPFVRLFSYFYQKRKRSKILVEEKLARFRPRSFFFYLLYYLELRMRYRKAMNSKTDIILFDRYFYDELVFAPPRLFLLLKRLTPKPDLCVILRVPPSILKKRGVSISAEQHFRFYNSLSRVSLLSPTITIDATKPLSKLSRSLQPYLTRKA